VRVPGTWSPSYVLGVVVLGIAVATTIWKNKIDEWLLHDEQDDVNTKQVKRKLDELEQQLLQQLKHSRQP
jgi:myo-inositol catabolism protein IolC